MYQTNIFTIPGMRMVRLHYLHLALNQCSSFEGFNYKHLK
jgi:hypothetical protein